MAETQATKATQAHVDLRDAILDAIRPFTDKLTLEEIIAVNSQLIGALIANLDQRSYSPSDAMAMVSENMLMGNREAVQALKHADTAGGVH